jgi:hypothetical protein
MQSSVASEEWRYIRASRHKPPGNATSGARRTLYAAAMRQSEEFFTLADAASYEVRPVLLYYGLNQAVRALIACTVAPRDPYEVSGHGTTCSNLSNENDLGSLTVSSGGKPGGSLS